MSRHSFPIDALPVSRADAVLALIDAPEAEQHLADVNSQAIGTVYADLAAADYLGGGI
ncbi:hypothetical protein D3C78_1720450 [compost metagenome]